MKKLKSHVDAADRRRGYPPMSMNGERGQKPSPKGGGTLASFGVCGRFSRKSERFQALFWSETLFGYRVVPRCNKELLR